MPDQNALRHSGKFEDEFGINIYQEKYQGRGASKANLLRGSIDVEDGYLVGKSLRKLYEYRTQGMVAGDFSRALPEALEKQFVELVARIEAGFAPPVLSSLSGAAQVLNFDTVTRHLDRAQASISQRVVAERDPGLRISPPSQDGFSRIPAINNRI